MTTPAKEWREEFDKQFTPHIGNHPEGADHGIADDIKDFIQNLLDQHSAQLVERVEKLRKETDSLVPVDNYEHPEYDQAVGFNQAIDEVVDIVRDKKSDGMPHPFGNPEGVYSTKG